MVSNARVALLIALALPLGATTPAQGQVVRVRRGAGLVVRAPYAAPVAVNVRGVLPGVPLVRPFLLPRRALLAVPPGGAVPPPLPPSPPRPLAGGEAPRYQPGVTDVGVRRQFPTAAELASFDDGALLNAALAATDQLDADLGLFNTGAGWQRYLRLPDDAFPAPTAGGRVTLGFDSISTTLARLNSVAANPEFRVIASVPSFEASRAALAEIVLRFGSTAAHRPASTPPPRPAPTRLAPAGPAPAAVEEVLPAPPARVRSSRVALPEVGPPSLSPPANARSSERSVLSR